MSENYYVNWLLDDRGFVTQLVSSLSLQPLLIFFPQFQLRSSQEALRLLKLSGTGLINGDRADGQESR